MSSELTLSGKTKAFSKGIMKRWSFCLRNLYSDYRNLCLCYYIIYSIYNKHGVYGIAEVHTFDQIIFLKLVDKLVTFAQFPKLKNL